mgnify:CR=1 FL=1
MEDGRYSPPKVMQICKYLLLKFLTLHVTHDMGHVTHNVPLAGISLSLYNRG